MGGSAISGELLIDWTRDELRIPMAICREYALPAYAGKDTLVIVNSYSGDTEESLSLLIDALNRKCMVICIGSGGRLLEAAQRLDLPHVRVPSGMPPRAALPFMFTPLIVIVEKLGLVHSVDNEFLETVKVLKYISEADSPGQPYEKNSSKQLASQILHTIPIIYGFGMYRGAAQRLKQQFNENGKTPAKWDYFSELNHNETVGWESSDEFLNDFYPRQARAHRDTITNRNNQETVAQTAQSFRNLEQRRLHSVQTAFSNTHRRLRQRLSCYITRYRPNACQNGIRTEKESGEKRN
jgi:glucose/mannose-6-phosphate isomerase